MNRHTPADGDESGLVGKIIPEVEGKSPAKCRLRQQTPDGCALAAIGSRQDFNVPQVLRGVQSGAKGLEPETQLPPKARLNLAWHVQQMNGETAVLVFDPGGGVSAQLLLE